MILILQFIIFGLPFRLVNIVFSDRAVSNSLPIPSVLINSSYRNTGTRECFDVTNRTHEHLYTIADYQHTHSNILSALRTGPHQFNDLSSPGASVLHAIRTCWHTLTHPHTKPARVRVLHTTHTHTRPHSFAGIRAIRSINPNKHWHTLEFRSPFFLFCFLAFAAFCFRLFTCLNPRPVPSHASNMPEISQDAFEVANPGAPSVTPQELRARANSGSGARPALGALTSISSPALLQPIASAASVAAAVPAPRVAAVVPKMHTAGHEYLYGYKRESSHR